jgi:hypothetical protein
MTEQLEAPQTEAEIREAGARVKRMIRYSVFFYIPLIVAFFYWLQPPLWGLWIAGAIAIEFVSYPFLIRGMDRATEQSVAELREAQGMTPADDLPDVGI